MKKLIFTNKGLTLIEIIIAMAIMGIISVAILMAYTTATLLSIRSGDRTNNVSNTASIIENTIANVPMSVDDVAETIEIDGNIINDVTYSPSNLNLRVNFHGGGSKPITATKTQVNKEMETIRGTKIQTAIEVYQP